MIQPFEMKETRPMALHDGVVSTTTAVWNMLTASQYDDLDSVKELAQRRQALISCQYDYTAPLHLAVREGHLDLVRYLVQRGADVNKSGAPWATPLAWARKKCYAEIESDLRQAGAR